MAEPSKDPTIQRRIRKRKIARISEGVLGTVSEIALSEIFFGMELLVQGGGPHPGKAWEAYYQSQKDLQDINYQSLKNAFFYLKRKGLIDYVKEKNITLPQITKQGFKRLRSSFPKYYKNRPWDKKIYLITYDVAEEKRSDRNLLRKQLKKIGCGMLQAIVWITPYNPHTVLQKFIKEKGLDGSVIISDTGKKGTIGKRTLQELITKVYNLPEINEGYRKFLRKFQNNETKETTTSQIAFKFFAALKKDPQLPFELLPLNWKGDEAYILFRQLTGKSQPETFWEEDINKSLIQTSE